MGSKKRKILWRRAVDRSRDHKAVFFVYLVLRMLALIALVLSALNGNWDNVFVCLLVLAIYMLPFFIEENLGIEVPSLLEVIILLHVFAAEILGELSHYYVQYPYWDTILHTVWGFLCAAVGFSLVSILNRNRKVKFELSPFYLALTAFCFSMTVGVLWEFFEFFVDVLFHSDMQKDTVLNTISSVALDPTKSNVPIVIKNITSMSVNGVELGLGGYLDIGLYDTMEDLMVNFIGAVVFSIIGYLDAKSPGRSKLVPQLIPRPMDSAQPGRTDYGEYNTDCQRSPSHRPTKRGP